MGMESAYATLSYVNKPGPVPRALFLGSQANLMQLESSFRSLIPMYFAASDRAAFGLTNALYSFLRFRT